MIGFVPVTHGEYLYDTIVRRFIDQEANFCSSIRGLSGIGIGGRADQFSQYFSGALAFNVTARVIKAAQKIIDHPDLGESLYKGNMLDFLCNQLKISPFQFNKADVNRLINLALESARCRVQPITKATIREILGRETQRFCYICGAEVFAETADNSTRIQYEHIWPRSFGGDSISENLLPSCGCCNNAKASMVLWQDGPVHSFILAPNPSADEFRIVTQRARIAKHRQFIFVHAAEQRITLKSAALAVGPYDTLSIQCDDPSDAADFFSIHF